MIQKNYFFVGRVDRIVEIPSITEPIVVLGGGWDASNPVEDLTEDSDFKNTWTTLDWRASQSKTMFGSFMCNSIGSASLYQYAPEIN